MGRVVKVLIVILAFSAVAGCTKSRQILGLDKKAPDEFAVYSRAPLSLPPNYTLRPPTLGTSRPQVNSTKNQAKKAIENVLVKSGKKPSKIVASPGIEALLKSTGGINADPTIRSIINRETSILAEQDKSLSDKLTFWSVPNEYGSVVDPGKEARRIQQNQALGTPLNKGKVPTIKRKRKAVLEGIFN